MTLKKPDQYQNEVEAMTEAYLTDMIVHTIRYGNRKVQIFGHLEAPVHAYLVEKQEELRGLGYTLNFVEETDRLGKIFRTATITW